MLESTISTQSWFEAWTFNQFFPKTLLKKARLWKNRKRKTQTYDFCLKLRFHQCSSNSLSKNQSGCWKNIKKGTHTNFDYVELKMNIKYKVGCIISQIV